MRFDLADLRLFLSVTESSSITQGANNAHVAPPSASERIRNMEHEIGTALLFRESRGVRPTPAGIALAHHARTILKQNEVMRGELSEYANGLRGRIRLLSNTAGLSEFLPDLLSDYLHTHQNIDLEFEERPSHEIIQAISCGVGDAGIGIVADIFPIGQLRSFPFVVDQLVLVVPAGHAFSELTGVEFSQALTQDFVGLMRHSALMKHLESHATRLSKSIRWRVRLGTFDAVCRLVEQGIGVAVVPERAAVRAQLNGNLVCIKLSDAWARRRLMICVRELDELPKHARQLVDHILSKSAIKIPRPDTHLG
jgi:DNA-binding transcriptional LysR family regulator